MRLPTEFFDDDESVDTEVSEFTGDDDDSGNVHTDESEDADVGGAGLVKGNFANMSAEMLCLLKIIWQRRWCGSGATRITFWVGSDSIISMILQMINIDFPAPCPQY